MKTTADENKHEGRNEGDRQNGGERHGKRLGPGKGTKHSSFLSFEEENGQERNKNDEKGEKDGRTNLLGGAFENGFSLFFRHFGSGLRRRGHALRQVAVAVFHHDNTGIDKDADGERQATQRHDVRAYT